MARIRGTHYLSKAGFETDDVRALMLRKRLQILVHSCLYYNMDTNLIKDSIWDIWAKELVQLQKEYPQISKQVDYYEDFKDFDGSTGFDLPINNPEIIRKAYQLTNINREHKKCGQRVHLPNLLNIHK